MNEIPKIGDARIKEAPFVLSPDSRGGFDEKGLFLIGEKYRDYMKEKARLAKLRGEETFNAIVKKFPPNFDPEAQVETRARLATTNKQIDDLAKEARGEITTIIETPVTI